MQLQKENPAECTGEGKRRKRNIEEEIRTVDSDKFEFCYEIMTSRCEGKGEGYGREGR